MSTVTIEALSNLIHDYISAQAKRDAERDKRDAERDAETKKRDAERDKRDAEIKKWDAEIKKRDIEQKEAYEKQWKKLQQDLGKLGHSYGDQVEAMFVNLGPKFDSQGYSFPREAKVTTFFDKKTEMHLFR